MKLSASLLALILATAAVSACTRSAPAPAVGPAGQPSSSDVNPVTGTRGGSGSH